MYLVLDGDFSPAIQFNVRHDGPDILQLAFGSSHFDQGLLRPYPRSST